MRAYLSVMFDRPVVSGRHYISPGGYEVRTKDGKTYQFDFNESNGGIDDKNPAILHFELRDEDDDTFPLIQELRHHIHEVTEFTECYMYTGEPDEEEIYPVRILEFVIEDYQTEFADIPKSTEFVTVRADKDKDGCLYTYIFTKKLLNTCTKERMS